MITVLRKDENTLMIIRDDVIYTRKTTFPVEWREDGVLVQPRLVPQDVRLKAREALPELFEEVREYMSQVVG